MGLRVHPGHGTPRGTESRSGPHPRTSLCGHPTPRVRAHRHPAREPWTRRVPRRTRPRACRVIVGVGTTLWTHPSAVQPHLRVRRLSPQGEWCVRAPCQTKVSAEKVWEGTVSRQPQRSTRVTPVVRARWGAPPTTQVPDTLECVSVPSLHPQPCGLFTRP